MRGFRLSRDNFSNQEILNTAFGAVGALEISDSAYLQVFLLPSSRWAVPLWRAFSEGVVGAFFLGNRDSTEDRSVLGIIKSYIEGELDRPVIPADPDRLEDATTGNLGGIMFRELLNALIDRQALTGEAQT